jgi:hypothetical protein
MKDQQVMIQVTLVIGMERVMRSSFAYRSSDNPLDQSHWDNEMHMNLATSFPPT